jgi:hypothetical protein
LSEELAVFEAAPVSTNLFGAATPEEVLKKAQELATPLAEVVREHEMITVIHSSRGDSEHVNIEGWQTLGAMLGISGHTVWTRPLDGAIGWECRAEARTRAGEVVGSAEAMCERTERGGQWRHADQQAMRSMSQTRAHSKALSSALRFVMTLAHFSGTPVEEVPQAEVPAWAQPARDLSEVMKACADVLGGGQKPVDATVAMERAREVCKRIYNDCGGQIPMVVWQVFSLQLAALMDRPPDEVAEVEEPEASTAFADASDAEIGGGDAELDAREAIEGEPPDPTATDEENPS